MGWYKVQWESPTTGKWLETDGGEFDGDTSAVKWAKGLLSRKAASGICQGTLYEVTAGDTDRVVTYLSGRG